MSNPRCGKPELTVVRAGLSCISGDAPQFKPIFPQSFFKYIYIYKAELGCWLSSMPYSSPTEPSEIPARLHVAGFTLIYFAYESLYLTLLFIKNLTDVVMHF